MKLSIFNSRIQLSKDSDIIYNSLSNKFIGISPSKKLDDLSSLTERELSQLKTAGIIVDRNLDEYCTAVQLWKSHVFSKDSFLLFINPTLKCNFNCWYCYEDHSGNRSIDNPQIESIKIAIVKLLNKFPTLSVSFFGGEPLLTYDRVIKPLIEFAIQQADLLSKKIEFSFTSNGYLITDEMLTFFSKNRVKFLQITLDGGRTFHNKTRVSLANDSYDTITRNIKNLLSVNITVTLRINVTDENIDSCQDICDWLSELTSEEKNRLRVCVSIVWQVKKTELLLNKLDLLLDQICDMGIYAYSALHDNIRNMCYADCLNSMLINYDGNVFKCTAIDFKPEEREAYLNQNGEIAYCANLVNKVEKRLKNNRCKTCRVMPLCFGGCYKSVNENANDYCLYDEKEKDKMVINIIKDRVRRNILVKKNVAIH